MFIFNFNLLQNWRISYYICSNCLSSLKTAYDFKKQCISLETQRHKLNSTQNLEAFPMLICYNCDASFSCKQTLERHITNTHSSNNEEKRNDNESLKCEKCEKLYKNSKVYEKHIKNCDGVKRHINHKKTDYECSNCFKYYTTSKILKHHLKLCKNQPLDENMVELEQNNGTSKEKNKFHRTKRLYICETCNGSFNSVILLKRHCTVVHSLDSSTLKPFSCDICSKKFSFQSNLKRHRDYHNNIRSHVCTICGKAFVTRKDLKCHEFIHNNERTFKCESCDKAFKTSKNLNTHQKIVHNDPSLWKYCCSYCQKRFPMKSNYDAHIRRHENDKRHACDICNKTFVTKSEMRIHVRLHSNIREFKCEHCSKEYKNKYGFQIHLAKMHGVGTVKIPIRERKYACHICPSTFYDISKLNRHLCSHTGIKPFECSHCDKKFRDKWNLRQHLKTTHNITNITE